MDTLKQLKQLYKYDTIIKPVNWLIKISFPILELDTKISSCFFLLTMYTRRLDLRAFAKIKFM